MKWFCTIFLLFFAHTRLFFLFIEGVYLHTCNGVCIFTPSMMVCVFSRPTRWCVYFHALQCNACIFTHAWLYVYSLQFWQSVYSQAVLKLFWCKAAFHFHCFIWRNKSSDLQKKSYLWWFQLATLWLVAWCSTIEPKKFLIQVVEKFCNFFYNTSFRNFSTCLNVFK